MTPSPIIDSVVASRHVLLSAAAAWSHLRSVCVLAAKLIAERSITVTLLVPYYLNIFEKAQKEVERCLSDAKSPPGVVRIIAFGKHVNESFSGLDPDVPAFQEFWRKTLDGSTITCSSTKKEYPGIAKPSLVFLDPFQYNLLVQIREIPSSSPTPVFTWVTVFTGMIIGLLLPKKYGGLAEDILPEYSQEEAKKGRHLPIRGEVRHVEGIPNMYDWEIYPQNLENIPVLGSQGGIPIFLHKSAKMIHAADGLATVGSTGYDGNQLLSIIDRWANENGKSSFHLGPILPLKPGTSEFSQAQLDAEVAAAPQGVGDRVAKFLKSKKEYSVIYICFGTSFWPTNPNHLWKLLEILTVRDIPFILSHASKLAEVPEHIKKQYSNDHSGLLLAWAPQQTILSHKAVGWFVTHGGAGSAVDALTQGVPMIGWPFAADQPFNIAHLVHILDVAFEFIEVRTGADYGLKPIYLAEKTPTGTLEAFQEELKGILNDLSSEVGCRKRANAQRQREILAQAWAPGGSAYDSLQNLVQQFSL